MKIYEVLLLWSCSDDDGFETHHFTDYATALNKFNETIKDELLSGTSWICKAFDEKTGKLNKEDYDLFSNSDCVRGEQEQYWQLFSKDDGKTVYFQLYLKIFDVIPPNNGFKIEITYNDNVYAFRDGSEAYIFHAGIYNDFDKQYGMETLLEYVELVHACYLKDDNATPLGHLADYIAEHWEEVKEEPLRDILEKFYWTVI